MCKQALATRARVYRCLATLLFHFCNAVIIKILKRGPAGPSANLVGMGSFYFAALVYKDRESSTYPTSRLTASRENTHNTVRWGDLEHISCKVTKDKWVAKVFSLAMLQRINTRGPRTEPCGTPRWLTQQSSACLYIRLRPSEDCTRELFAFWESILEDYIGIGILQDPAQISQEQVFFTWLHWVTKIENLIKNGPLLKLS